MAVMCLSLSLYCSVYSVGCAVLCAVCYEARVERTLPYARPMYDLNQFNSLLLTARCSQTQPTYLRVGIVFSFGYAAKRKEMFHRMWTRAVCARADDNHMQSSTCRHLRHFHDWHLLQQPLHVAVDHINDTKLVVFFRRASDSVLRHWIRWETALHNQVGWTGVYVCENRSWISKWNASFCSALSVRLEWMLWLNGNWTIENNQIRFQKMSTMQLESINRWCGKVNWEFYNLYGYRRA